MVRSADSQGVLRKARYAFAVAQLELRRLLILRAHKQYNPNQPRVPAGSSDGGQWTSGGGSGGGPRSEYAQLRPRRLSGGYRIVGGRAHVVTPAQEARLDITAAQARALVREVQRHDPSWRPTPSIYEGVEGQILANQSEVQQAAARLRELGAREPASRSLHDIFRPGGQILGSRQGRASGGTRTVTRPEFSDLLEALSPNAQPVPSPRSYEGLWYRRPDGSVFGVRRSKDSGITIDVIRSNHPSIDNGDKVHKK
jgi:hypothetical protein